MADPDGALRPTLLQAPDDLLDGATRHEFAERVALVPHLTEAPMGTEGLRRLLFDPASEPVPAS